MTSTLLSSCVLYNMKSRNGRSFDFQNQLAGEGESALVSWYPRQYRQPGTGTLHWSTAMTTSIGVSLRVLRLDNRSSSLLATNRGKKLFKLKKKHWDRGDLLQKSTVCQQRRQCSANFLLYWTVAQRIPLSLAVTYDMWHPLSGTSRAKHSSVSKELMYSVRSRGSNSIFKMYVIFLYWALNNKAWQKSITSLHHEYPIKYW